MPEWVIPLLTAIGGAVVALIGRELVEWWKRPRFSIAFEAGDGRKPHIPDFNDETRAAAGQTFRIGFLRLTVRNKGRRAALNCVAKLTITLRELEHVPYTEHDQVVHRVTLHWSSNDPALYAKDGDVRTGYETEKIFAPIDLNIGDEETVDVLRLPYSYSTLPDTSHAPNPYPFMESASVRQLRLQPNWTYHGKVTVYASNASSGPFGFTVRWDGTVEGFGKAFAET